MVFFFFRFVSPRPPFFISVFASFPTKAIQFYRYTSGRLRVHRVPYDFAVPSKGSAVKSFSNHFISWRIPTRWVALRAPINEIKTVAMLFGKEKKPYPFIPVYPIVRITSFRNCVLSFFDFSHRVSPFFDISTRYSLNWLIFFFFKKSYLLLSNKVTLYT